MTKNIVKWLEKNLGPTRSSHNGSELSVCCPFCEDSKFHLYYNVQKDVWNCFKCNSSGRGLDLIISYTGVDAYTAARYLSPAKVLPVKPEPPLTVMPIWYQPLLPEPKQLKPGYNLIYNYALSRKFTRAQIEFYGFGYAVGDYACRNRLIIPVERGYYQARAINKSQEPKYKNPEYPKEDRLFNHRFLGSKHIAICEGAFSAIAATRDSCPAVAILGKKATYEQMIRIARSKPDMVDIAFDAGTEWLDTTVGLAKFLYSYDIQVRIRHYKFGDPDECSEFELTTYNPSYQFTARLERLK